MLVTVGSLLRLICQLRVLSQLLHRFMSRVFFRLFKGIHISILLINLILNYKNLAHNLSLVSLGTEFVKVGQAGEA